MQHLNLKYKLDSKTSSLTNAFIEVIEQPSQLRPVDCSMFSLSHRISGNLNRLSIEALSEGSGEVRGTDPGAILADQSKSEVAWLFDTPHTICISVSATLLLNTISGGMTDIARKRAKVLSNVGLVRKGVTSR